MNTSLHKKVTAEKDKDGNSLLEKVVIDKSGSNNAGLENINMLLLMTSIFVGLRSFRLNI